MNSLRPLVSSCKENTSNSYCSQMPRMSSSRLLSVRVNVKNLQELLIIQLLPYFKGNLEKKTFCEVSKWFSCNCIMLCVGTWQIIFQFFFRLSHNIICAYNARVFLLFMFKWVFIVMIQVLLSNAGHFHNINLWSICFHNKHFGILVSPDQKLHNIN